MRNSIKLSCVLIFMFQFVWSQTKSPSEFLGFELGERFSMHHQVTDYFKHVADQNDNVKLVKYGNTYEKRPLHVAIVTSQENFSRLEEIRMNQLRAARMIEGDGQKQDVAVLWLSYNVHGNESVSTEVAMKMLYELINPDNKETKQWLKNTIVIIDPCLNPDGRERYVNWYIQHGNMPYNSNPDANEHHEPWPGGRTNHYFFDLNRDWAWATQVETQQRLVLYNNWMPNVHVDFHEMGVDDSYYFAPAAAPFHEVITDFQKEFQVKVGENHAKYFDQKGWLYFTKETFDLLYPSYGDTYPTMNGGIGMTYEQAGSGRAGLGILNKGEDLLTLKDRIEHHFTTSLSTLEVTSENAVALNDQFSSYFKSAQQSPKDEYKTYVIKNNNEDKVKSLMRLLDRHKIAYGTSSSDMSTKAYNYKENKITKLDIKKSDLIISSYQPKSNLVKVLFEPETTLSDSLTYDITAWSLPYARGLEAYALKTRLEPDPYEKEQNRKTSESLSVPYAYVSKWNSTEDLAYLSYLLQKKIKVRFSQKPFRIEGKNFAPGSLVITRAGNEKFENFDSIIRNSALQFERHLTEVKSGLVTSGADFGSGRVHYIKAPKVALLTGKEISSYNVGSIWHFFEQQIKYKISILNTSYFSKVDLHDYDVLIIPSGNYHKVLDKEQLTALNQWVQKGGKIIAFSSAISVFAASDDFEISVYESEDMEKAALKSRDSLRKENRLKTYNDSERIALSNWISGSIFKVSLDNTNPLGFGYGKEYYTLKQGRQRYAYLKNGYNVSVMEGEVNQISGFAGTNALKGIETSLVYGVENKGKGTVVYLVDDPLFRSFWENGKLLFGNAIFMVGQ